MKIEEFTHRYASIMHKDPITQQQFIKLPIVDVFELSYMQQALIKAIKLLTELEDELAMEVKVSIYWLSRIVLDSYPESELEGIAKFLNSKSDSLY
jgi:hypothetical protein